MAVLRTPESRFANLPDYPFAPHYLDLAKAIGRSGEARMHYVEEGRGKPILCLHGEPSWSFLYRRMIPILAMRGRVLAPDLFGFGKSDKFTERADYTYKMHHDAVLGFIEALDLRDITLVCQDWGGLLGLQIAGQHPERFARLVIMNTALPTGEEEVGPGFLAWRDYVANTPDLPIGKLFGRSIFPEDRRAPEILAGYDAPYPDRSYKEGAQAFRVSCRSRPIRRVPPRTARRGRRSSAGPSRVWSWPATKTPSSASPRARSSSAAFRPPAK
jgi:haloalkane dehalogenase